MSRRRLCILAVGYAMLEYNRQCSSGEEDQESVKDELVKDEDPTKHEIVQDNM